MIAIRNSLPLLFVQVVYFVHNLVRDIVDEFIHIAVVHVRGKVRELVDDAARRVNFIHAATAGAASCFVFLTE
jgi:hypothetical protein